MSFLKITDPTKRDLLVQELINKRKQIYQDSMSETIGSISQEQEISKFFKPITQKIETSIEPQLKSLPLRRFEAIEDIPLAVALAEARPNMTLDENATKTFKNMLERDQFPT